jgi:hypothetical protein
MLPSELQNGLALLPSADRRWLLSQLSPAERSKVEALFKGLPAGPARAGLNGSNGEAAPAKPRSTGPLNGSAQDQSLLDGASVEDMRSLLATLPASCVVLVLKTKTWSWSADVMVGLSKVQKDAIAESMKHESAGRKQQLAQWLVHQLAESLRKARANAAAPDRRFDVLLDGTA